MLFEELIEHHRVHLVVPDAVHPAAFVPDHEVRIYLLNVWLRELRRAVWIVTTSGVAIERAITDGRVIGASSIANERLVTVGGIESASSVAKQCAITGGVLSSAVVLLKSAKLPSPCWRCRCCWSKALQRQWPCFRLPCQEEASQRQRLY